MNREDARRIALDHVVGLYHEVLTNGERIDTEKMVRDADKLAQYLMETDVSLANTNDATRRSLS